MSEHWAMLNDLGETFMILPHPNEEAALAWHRDMIDSLRHAPHRPSGKTDEEFEAWIARWRMRRATAAEVHVWRKALKEARAEGYTGPPAKFACQLGTSYTPSPARSYFGPISSPRRPAGGR